MSDAIRTRAEPPPRARRPTAPPERPADHARLADAVALLRQTEAERDAALRRLAQLERELVHAAAVRDVEVRRAQALASRLWHLQRHVLELLDSHRWAVGRRLGNLVDGALRRRRDVAEDERIRALIAETRALLGGVEEQRVRLDAARGRAAAGEGAAADLRRFLCRALVDPVAYTPLDATARHALACMEDHRDRLVQRWAGRRDGPLVSIVMPTYNRAHLLPRAIGSVLAQSYGRWELLVVDDGSTDGTEGVVRSYADERIVPVLLDGNHGVSHARNRGLARARGELVAYLDSDNYWHEHYLLLLAGALDDHPGRDAAYCAQEIWEVTTGETGESQRRLDGVRFGPFNRALLENRNVVDLNAFVHRRSLVERHGAFDESLPRLVDWELFLRCTADSRPVAVPCVLSAYEFGTAKNQLTRTLPVAPATTALDAATLRREPLEIALPRPVARRYRRQVLFAPLGPRRAGRPRPVTVAVAAPVEAAMLATCLEALRAAAVDGDVRFVVQEATDAAARNAVAQAATAPDVEALAAPGGRWWRAAAAAAAGRDLVLLDAEVVVVPGWLEACWEVLDTVPGVGLVAPRVTVLPGAVPVAEHVPYARARREADITLSLVDGTVADPWLDDARGFVGLNWARFTCAYLPAGALAAIGPPPAIDDPLRAARVYGDVLRTLAGRQAVYTPHAKVYYLP